MSSTRRSPTRPPTTSLGRLGWSARRISRTVSALRRRLGDPRDETGSSLVEFIGLAVLLLIPVVYLIIGVAGLQAASYATVAAADQAAKVYTAAADEPAESTRTGRGEAAVARALEDFGIDASQAELGMHCPTASCSQDGDVVVVTVEVRVALPLVPAFGGATPSFATVSSTSAQVVSR